MSTASSCFLHGIPLTLPNRVTESSPDFYVSFNDVDVSLYGAETTAVVLGQMQRFYVLSGNHEKALVGKSFPECLEYLHAHASELNHRSEPLPPRGSTVADILSAPRARR